MTSRSAGPNFSHLLSFENAKLGEVLVSVRTALDASGRARVSVEREIERMAEVTESHFRHEEENGYLREALEKAPQLASRAQALLEQHEALMEQLQKLCILTHSGVESTAWWRLIEGDFARFASRLLEHETAEEQLVQEAFADDGATAD